MQEILQTIYNNKEWIFSGIGIAILSSIIRIVVKNKQDKNHKNIIKIGKKNKR